MGTNGGRAGTGYRGAHHGVLSKKSLLISVERLRQTRAVGHCLNRRIQRDRNGHWGAHDFVTNQGTRGRGNGRPLASQVRRKTGQIP